MLQIIRGMFVVTIAIATTWPARAQVQVKPPAVPNRLFVELRSSDAGIRRRAANQLGALRAKQAVGNVISALTDRNAGVREAAAFALGQITDPKAVGPLIKALADKEGEVRASAAFSLGMLSDRKAIDALSGVLDDSEAAVRSSAVTALGLLQDAESLDEIIQLLDDSSFDVRYDAVWALGQIGEPEAAVHLRTALVNLDLIQIDDVSREAFRQAVQSSLENLRTGADLTSQSRPRRATDAQVAGQLSRPAAVRYSVRPAATERAARAGVKGNVLMRVLVGADGRPVRAYVARRLGYGLDQRAVETVLQYRFDPALLYGLPQTEWMDIEVKF